MNLLSTLGDWVWVIAIVAVVLGSLALAPMCQTGNERNQNEDAQTAAEMHALAVALRDRGGRGVSVRGHDGGLGEQVWSRGGDS